MTLLTQILLDAPTTVATRVPLAKLGHFSDSRYGEFDITSADVQAWKTNLDLLPGGRALIDLDHSAERPQPHRSTEAAGWITGIELEGRQAYADVEWTPLGKQAIADKRYLFFSPTYGEHTVEGVTHANVLAGGALTNRPFLNMPAVTLADPATVNRALDQDPVWLLQRLALDGALGDDVKTLATTTQAMRDQAKKAGNALPDGSYPIPDLAHLGAAITLARSGHGDVKAATRLIKRRAGELSGGMAVLKAKWPELAGDDSGKGDSRRSMELTADRLTTLGVTDETAQKRILDASGDEQVKALADALKPPATEPPARTLEQQARADGKIVLDQAGWDGVQQQLKSLEADVAEGKAAKEELHQAKFAAAWDKALTDIRVLDNQRERWEKFYTLDAEGTITMLGDLPQLVSTKPIGSNTAVTLDQADAALDPGSQSYHAEKRVLDVRKQLQAAGKDPNDRALVAQTLLKQLEGDQ